MTDEKTCYNCGNKNCNVYYSMVKKDYKRHFETYEYNDFDCVNHNKWEELKMEEIHTDNTKTLQNSLERIRELERENAELKADNDARRFAMVMSENVEKKLRQENAELKEKLKPENCLKLLAKDGFVKFTSEQLTKAKELEYAKTIIKDLLDNSDEYARERAINFLRESE